MALIYSARSEPHDMNEFQRFGLNRFGLTPGAWEDHIRALEMTESAGNPSAVSPAGAVGRMQTMPDTLRDPGFGVRPANSNSDAERTRVGREYFAAMMRRYNGDVPRALAAYNAGPGTVDQAGGIPNIAETTQHRERFFRHLGGGEPTSTMQQVTDPALLAELQAAAGFSEQQPQPVTDPALLAELQAAAGFGEAKGDEKPSRSLPSMAGGVVRGAIKDPANALAQMLYNAVPGPVRRHVSAIDPWLYEKTGGVLGAENPDFNAQLRTGEQAYQAGRGPGAGIDWPRMGGNVLAGLAATRGLPVAPTFGGRVAQNALVGSGLGAATPVLQGDYATEKAKQVGLGAVAGAVATPVAEGLARVIMPRAASNPAVAEMRRGGNTPTVGQALGGRWNQAEQKLQSTPILGDAISLARGRSLDSWNVGKLNEALSVVGKRLPKGTKAGDDAINDAYSLGQDAFESALRGMQSGVRLDAQAQRELGTLRHLALRLPKKESKQFKNYFENRFANQVAAGRNMSATTFKEVSTDLRDEARAFTKSIDPYQQKLGTAYEELHEIINRAASRQHPTYAREYKKAQKTWAMLRAMGSASISSASSGGIATPAQLLAALRARDATPGKIGFQRGTAPGKKAAASAQKVMGPITPNSFTGDRVMMALATGGGLGYIEPAALTALGVGTAGYLSPLAQRALVGAVASRPPAANALAQAVRQAAPAVAVPFASGP